MTLDDLYGFGTGAALAKAVGGDLRYADLPDGRLRVYVDWPVSGSRFKIDCSPKAVRIVCLEMKVAGLYDTLMDQLPWLFKQMAVNTILMDPPPPLLATAKSKGSWVDTNGKLTLDATKATQPVIKVGK